MYAYTNIHVYFICAQRLATLLSERNGDLSGIWKQSARGKITIGKVLPNSPWTLILGFLAKDAVLLSQTDSREDFESPSQEWFLRSESSNDISESAIVLKR